MRLLSPIGETTGDRGREGGTFAEGININVNTPAPAGARLPLGNTMLPAVEHPYPTAADAGTSHPTRSRFSRQICRRR